MNALSRHLSNRRSAGLVVRSKCLKAVARLPAPVRRWAERKVWSGPFLHMRSPTPEITVEIGLDGHWIFKRNAVSQAESLPLERLVGRIDRPVSVIATGPTARNHGWESIRQGGRFVVAVNGAATFLKSLGIVPDLLVVTDPMFALSGADHFRNAPGIPLVTTWRAASTLVMEAPAELCKRPFSIIERVNAWYGVPAVSLGELYAINRDSGSPFHFPEDQKLQLKVGWSNSPQQGFFSGCNVVLAALQVVVGLGATHIEIVGMDLSDQGRIYEEGLNPQPSLLQAQYEKFIRPSFEVMHRALKGSGVNIRNVSPVCPLPQELFQL